MIRATQADRPAIETFLSKHITTSMFPLSNLRNHGMAGGHPRSLTFWLRWKTGQITDVLAISDEGMVFPQCPTGPWGDVAVVLAGQTVKGALGAADQVARLRSALGLPNAAGLDVVEPLYRLALDELVMPDVSGCKLYPLQDAPLPLIEGWRAHYNAEALVFTHEDAAVQAVKDVAGYLKADSHRVLVVDDTYVAMTGFNAALPNIVQIGGVYTPPALRSCGHARKALALHLQEARDAGVKDAVLFAANPAAERAYQAIGFHQTGHFAIAIYDEPQVIHG